MAKTRYDNPQDKKRLQDRAIMLKPNVPGVVATERGWAIARPNGTMELLVSYGGLDTLLGDVDHVQEGEPIVIQSEQVDEEEQAELEAEIDSDSTTETEAPQVAAKKPGRPKKEVKA